MDLRGRSFLKDADLSAEEYGAVLDLADQLRRDKRDGSEQHRLMGKHIVLLFEKTSTRTRSAFEVAVRDQGGHATYLGPGESQFGVKESTKDTARVLGRLFDGIEFRGFRQSDAEILADFSGVPVWNGLTDRWHPTQSLADLLTMRDHAGRPLTEVSVCFLGDAANNTCASLLTAGALMGMDVRVAAPAARRPAPEVWRDAHSLAAASGGSLTLTDDPREGVRGVDFLYTDVWLSLGEPEELWDERIDLLQPYQVNAALVAATGNPEVKLLHCLPSFHNTDTGIGRRIFEKRGLQAMEVTDEVFESPASVVFDEAENRLHTIKAVLVATLSGLEV
ncbi:MAG: ornithine carbamoyltransferase [Actinomycetota bacterium]|nr:ornithine carbamoyltransferase [Actinomycetota bacterium]